MRTSYTLSLSFTSDETEQKKTWRIEYCMDLPLDSGKMANWTNTIGFNGPSQVAEVHARFYQALLLFLYNIL